MGAALLSVLSPEATEDLVGVYLQEVRGYRVVPSTAKRSTQAYEFALRGGGLKGSHVAGRARYGERAVVQVKSGAVALSPVDYAYLLAEGDTDRVFLFSSRGGYPGSPVEGIECLSPGDLTAFAYRYDELLPNEIAHWIDVLERLGWSFASSNRQDPTR